MLKKAVANPVIANRANGASGFQQRGVSGTSSAPAAPQSSFGTRPENGFHPAPRGPLTQLKQAPNSGALNTGLKRNSSGLVKALSTEHAFDDPFYPTLPKQFQQSRSQPSLATELQGFDEDYEQDLEEILLEPIKYPPVTYPDLQQSGRSRENVATKSAVQPAKENVIDLTGSFSESPEVKKNGIPSSSTGVALGPWSSSPVEHLSRPNAFDRFRHDTTADDANGKPKPKKRRVLPWSPEENEPENPPAKNSTLAWDFTHSAVKQQQRIVRDATKKRVKTTDTDDGRALAMAKKKKSTPYQIFLSDEQQAILNMVVDGKKSVFFTGSAGTGKSVLLRQIIASLRRKYAKEPDRISVTASTGLAACNIGGVTLHSFSGIGLGNTTAAELVKKIKRNQKAKHRWMRTKVLIIDEVSMVDGDLFDKLEAIARQMRNNGRPFGGIQLVITGDFFQYDSLLGYALADISRLPPVPESGRRAKFAFEASSWVTTIDQTIRLHRVFRQKDPDFANMLNEMREGHLTKESIDKWKSLSRALSFNDDIDATELFSTRYEVERANQDRLKNLPGETRIFEARDGGKVTDKQFRDKLLANVMAPQSISLKKGAQVMLIKNFDETLVNGSLGKVVGFMSESQFDSYQESESYMATQGGGMFEPQEEKVTVDLPGTGAAQRLPVVRFAIADGTTRDLLCRREQWSIEQPNGEVQASRSQIPLILAWALSIHKAQGQTLERVKVNLSRAFEKGQAYVALSRATSMAGLQVIGFDASKVRAHEQVHRFYNSLSRLEASRENEAT
jgi:ATP-dependent DNA helicase PIF1